MAADPRAVITLIILLVILFSPTPAPETLPQARNRLREGLRSEVQYLDVLNSSSYGDLDPAAGKWLNISGVGRAQEQDEAWGWNSLVHVKERARQISGYVIGEEGLRRIDGLKHDDLKPDSENSEKRVEEGNKESKESVAAPDDIPLYYNITGSLHGSWTRSPVQHQLAIPTLNMTPYWPEGPFGPAPIHAFERNLTGTTGKLTVAFEELDDDSRVLRQQDQYGRQREVARELRAQVGLRDGDGDGDGAGDSWEAMVYGVHFPQTGNILLATTSAKFGGIFALPHMAMSEYDYGLAKELLNRTLGTTVREQEDGQMHSLNPWSSAPEGHSETAFSTPNCELIVYLQQHPLHLPTKAIGLIEQEVRFPSGAMLPPAESMHFSFLAFSPDCGYAFESVGPPDSPPQDGQHLMGLKVEVSYQRARHHLVLYLATLAGQLHFLLKQMRDASTPSTRSRISWYTVALLGLGDGFVTMSFCLTSLFVPGLWVLLVAAGFFAFMGVSFFGMRFLMDIWLCQAPERERAERERREEYQRRRQELLGARANTTLSTATPGAAAATTAAPTSTSTNTPLPGPPPVTTSAQPATLPLPSTARRPIDTGASPIIMSSDQDNMLEGTEDVVDQPTQTNATGDGDGAAQQRAPGFGSLYTKFYFLLLATLLVSLNATSWSAGLRRFYFTTVSLFYLSFWAPQIYRNALRNCRHALRWDFVVGESVLRLVPFAYFYGYKDNIIFAEVDVNNLAVLVIWVWLQCCVLFAQELLGPRAFVPKGWFPETYDYHPILRADEEGGNLPIGAEQVATAATSSSSSSSAAAPTSPSSPSAAARKHASSSSSAGGGGPLSPLLQPKPASESKDSANRTFDCAICMQELEVPVLGGASDAESQSGSGWTSGALLLERRKYMVTPCRHIFHSVCLEGWMKYRLQCPICREDLPPV